MLWRRIVSGLALAPIVVTSILWGGVLFDIMVALSAYLSALEWTNIVQPAIDPLQKQRFAAALPMAIVVLSIAIIQISPPYFLPALGLTMSVFALCLWMCRWPRSQYLFLGLPYLGATVLALVALRRHQPDGLHDVLILFIAVWATDICAYAAGRIFGGAKLAPDISPNKTWSGAIGGVVGCIIAVLITYASFGSLTFWQAGLTGFALSVLTQCGDLLESAAKRAFGVKDSGWLIPGHGGILDRIDGLLLAAPVFACYRFLIG